MSDFTSISDALSSKVSDGVLRDAGKSLLDELQNSFDKDPAQVLDVLNHMQGAGQALPEGFPSADSLFGGDSPININVAGDLLAGASGEQGGLDNILQTVGKLVEGLSGGQGGGADILGELFGEGEGLGGIVKIATQLAPAALMIL